jgi:hypothetical protein
MILGTHIFFKKKRKIEIFKMTSGSIHSSEQCGVKLLKGLLDFLISELSDERSNLVSEIEDIVEKRKN